MKKTQSEPQQVRRTSDPWFDINVDEVILPLDEIYQMGDMMNIPDDDFIDVEAQTERHHKANWDVTSYSILHVDHDKKHRKDEDLHIVLKIPTPRQTHVFSVVYEIVNKK